MSARTDAVAISTTRLADSDFEFGPGYVATSADSLGFGNSMNLSEGGLMSSKPIDPYSGLNQFTGATKAQALIASGKFDEAGDLARSLAKRGMNKQLGHVYNELGDHSNNLGKADAAWGWYTLAAANSDTPDDIVHAHFGIGQYYTDQHDIPDAEKQLQAVIDLSSANQADKDRAAALQKQIKAQ
jgi:tetratricopeptide (TPR) repeat protein